MDRLLFLLRRHCRSRRRVVVSSGGGGAGGGGGRECNMKVGWVVDGRWIGECVITEKGEFKVACGFLFSETSVGRSKAAAAA
jgi:hypothetical protein